MKRILVATGNEGKLREFAEALAPAGYEVLGLDALEALSDRAPVEESGETFEENARLKAEAYSRRTALPVLADDSGLEVDALDGRPGVLSARFGGGLLSDAARSRAVLKEMIDVPEAERSARFRCVLALAREGRTLATFEGVVEGRILTSLRGAGGFGYDPIFFHPPSGKTFAEMSVPEKRAVSHRGRAVAAFLKRGTGTF